MSGPRTRNVTDMSLAELGNVLWNSDCPIARAVVLEEIERRAS